MFEGYICNCAVTAYEVCTLTMDMEQICANIIARASRGCVSESGRERERRHAPTCSPPLKTYNLHPIRGLRASGGSLYLSRVLVPSAFLTVFVAAASKPDGAKLGLALSSGAAVADTERDRERDCGRERRGDAERRAEPPLRSSPWSSRRLRSRSRSSRRRSPLLSWYSRPDLGRSLSASLSYRRRSSLPPSSRLCLPPSWLS